MVFRKVQFRFAKKIIDYNIFTLIEGKLMQSVIRYPNTVESIKIFKERMLIIEADPSINELTEDDLKSSSVIWIKIKELAPKWLERKKAGIAIPSYPIFRKDYWTEFSKNCAPSNFIQLEQFIKKTNGVGKTAIDMGCGTGYITKSLLEKGWNVIAVDPCFNALEILAEKNKPYLDQLTLVCKSITKFTPDHPVDLVVCKDVFPHMNPSKFQAVFQKIHHLYLKKDGFLMGTIFATDNAPSKISKMNQLKEIGAWFLPDKRFILPMLEGTGYKVERTSNSLHTKLEKGPRLCFQFSAQKI